VKSMRSIAILIALTCATSVQAATITVRKDGSGDYMVLQQALDVAASGDTVLVGPGEYTESSMVRLDGYGYDIESFGCFVAANVTLIGSGVESTFIGPTSPRGSPGTLSPKCLVQDVDGGWLRICDLTIRNCYEGLFGEGDLFMERCRVLDNSIGIAWFKIGSVGWIRNSSIEREAVTQTSSAFDIGALTVGGGVSIEECSFGDHGTIRGVQEFVFQRCQMSGLQMLAGARASILDCTDATSDGGVVMALGAGAYCEIRNSELHRDFATLVIDQSAPGSRFVVENSRLEGGLHGVLYSGDGAGACEIHNCDLVKGSGPMVECAFSATQATHDLSNNYWGTTSESDIQGWVYDHNDNPGRGATVIYSPYSGQSLPTESTTWGDLKAVFR
jgi:hypothetical protein